MSRPSFYGNFNREIKISTQGVGTKLASSSGNDDHIDASSIAYNIIGVLIFGFITYLTFEACKVVFESLNVILTIGNYLYYHYCYYLCHYYYFYYYYNYYCYALIIVIQTTTYDCCIATIGSAKVLYDKLTAYVTRYYYTDTSDTSYTMMNDETSPVMDQPTLQSIDDLNDRLPIDSVRPLADSSLVSGISEATVDSPNADPVVVDVRGNKDDDSDGHNNLPQLLSSSPTLLSSSTPTSVTIEPSVEEVVNQSNDPIEILRHALYDELRISNAMSIRLEQLLLQINDHRTRIEDAIRAISKPS